MNIVHQLTGKISGKPVAGLSNAQAGDVIVYDGHVAIYDGKGGVIHASNKKEGIKNSPKADYKKIIAVRRFTDGVQGGNNINSEGSTNSAPQGVVKESGDGYDEKYTSSAGITYTHYKQYQGSYAETPYWSGTIHSSGCGPSSIAILSSGLTNNNYTPKDIASHMSYTSYETLKAEMDSIGMQSEVIQSPSAQQIQDSLTNGKVMLVSVNSNTIFTGGSHIMALVDINDTGQVYICNPGSSSKYGWYDISEITKGCNYIVVTDAGKPAGAQSGSITNYVAEIATWQQVDTIVGSNDPNVQSSHETQYTMTTTTVDYQSMVEPYTMPFDYLWAYLVIGEEKKFVFELADLVYNSDIQITVHDKLTVDNDVDEKNYTERIKAEVNAKVKVTCSCGASKSGSKKCVHDPHSDNNYKTTTTVITQTNTVDIAVTRANVWIVDYKNDYVHEKPTKDVSTSSSTEPDTKYSPSGTGNSYSCDDINNLVNNLTSGLSHAIDSTNPNTIDAHNVSVDKDINVKYYNRYINIKHNYTNIVVNSNYVSGTPELKEKTDKDTAPNFVTIFNDYSNRLCKSRIKDASSWLFEILETNDTSNMLDLTKYLLYKATGSDYGKTEFDFTQFYPGELTSAGADDYIVHTQKSSQDIVIKDVKTLKKAFRGYSRSEKLVSHAQEFLYYQNKYNVNAVFAAAVAIDETTAGTKGNAVNGKHNWFNIKNGGGGEYKSYSSDGESIKHFYETIANGKNYFTQNKFTVHDIGMTYCENADKPGGWIENVNKFMTQMFSAVGINDTSSSSSYGGSGGNSNNVANSGAVGTAKDFLAKLEEYSQVAQREKPKWHYSNSSGKSTFKKAHKTNRYTNCALFVNWGLIDIGAMKPGMRFYIKVGSSSPTYRNGAKSELKKHATIKRVNKNAKSMIKSGELKPGDICLWSSIGHTNVYAGNKKWYDAGRYSANRAKGYSHDNHNFKTFGPVKTGVASHNVTYIIRLK